MIEHKTVLAIIPARGGSKRIPRKNLRLVVGKPLIAWTIEEAKKSRYIDLLVLSSEDSEIITIGRELGCEVPFVRPAVLAQDETPGVAPVLHAISQLPGFDIVALLQPTSPLREVADIDRCLEYFVANRADACVSVSQVRQNSCAMYALDSRGFIQPFDPSLQLDSQQRAPSSLYALNGAIYIATSEYLRINGTFIGATTLAFVMPAERSIDVDTEFDLKLATAILGEKSCKL